MHVADVLRRLYEYENDKLKKLTHERTKDADNRLKTELDDYNKIKCGYSLADWQWMHEEYISNPLYPEDLQYTTILGTLVRTKSELAIANAFERNGIPYRYEQKLVLSGRAYYPDFTILRPDGTIIIWEHNGLMSDPEYARKADERTKNYEAAGYRQHTNLICTYENDIKSPDDIDRIIQRFVIF